jgi:hypothetical protein
VVRDDSLKVKGKKKARARRRQEQEEGKGKKKPHPLLGGVQERKGWGTREKSTSTANLKPKN